jgi:hypothetical protein
MPSTLRGKILVSEKYISCIFHVFSEARDHILILNILFFNKLRQIIPEIRSEMRDLLLITSVKKKLTNVTFVIANPFYKKIWAGVPPLM